ncbi:GRAM domain-containing protein, partial [Dimargaris cristalligena]
KRNADFHMLFKEIPISELLNDDYGCALQRDILVQGRLYITDSFVCFHANIFGWVTHLVVQFSEIVSIEKRMTALIIPNAIQIATLHVKYFFGSFIYRDAAYSQLVDLWKKHHP